MAITYEEFQAALKIVNAYKFQIENHYSEVKYEVDNIHRFAKATPETKIREVEGMSIRLLNCLVALDEGDKLKDLEGRSIKNFFHYRNFGKKSVEELKELCFYAGVKLKP